MSRTVQGLRVLVALYSIWCILSWSASALVVPKTAAAPVQTPPKHPYYKPEPAYAKWGKLAVAETKRRYPSAKVVDYLHVGRRTLDAHRSEETFKLWLRQGQREFGVYVRITFDPQTDRVLGLSFTETPR